MTKARKTNRVYVKRARSFQDILDTRIEKQPNGCWHWTAHVMPNGYGQQFWQGRVQCAHRVVYMEMKGPIPEGLDLDHLCRNPRCVNPSHLEPVTRRVNTWRGNRQHLYDVKCRNGHVRTFANTRYHQKKTRIERVCLDCHKLTSRSYRQRQKEKSA